MIKKTRADFIVDKEKRINDVKLTDEVEKAMGYERWEKNPNKAGFAGLAFSFVRVNGVLKKRVQVVWTDDATKVDENGASGYIIKDLPGADAAKLSGVINKHNAV